MKRILMVIGILLLISTASAVTWSAAGTCWTATDGSYKIIKWNATGSHIWSVPVGVTTIDYVVIAGGGAGGSYGTLWHGSGGGGAGGMLNATGYSVTGSYTITVGAGGLGASGCGNAGSNSTIANATLLVNPTGGGTGTSYATCSNHNGGSGGGAQGDGAVGTGTAGQGNNGGTGSTASDAYGGGGGGGAGSAGFAGNGSYGGTGGSGRYNSITGESVCYAGGGGGGSRGGTNGTGLCGGGDGNLGATNGYPGMNETGGGGGAAGSSPSTTGGIGGSGGNGVVIIRYLEAGATPPLPSFTSNVTSGYSPLVVQFNDTSVTDPTAWNWSYQGISGGNTTQTWWSQIQNATGVFTTGNYTIKLNVTNASSYNISTANYWINVTAPSIISGFSGTPLSGLPGTEVTFTDESTGYSADNWTWNFGDGNTSTDQNPAHTYDFNGNFDVNLTVYNSTAGFDSELKEDYVVISDSGGLSGWNQQDIIMEGVYTLQIEFEDSSTHNPIPIVNVIDSNGYNTSTTVGLFTNTYNYSVIVIYYSSDGYVSGSRSYVMDEDRSATIYLTEATEPFNASPATVQSYPKYVTFHVKQGWGADLDEVLIEMTPVSTSTGDWDWLATILGVDLGEVPLNTNAMNQTTDSFGTATFYVFPTAKYNVTFTKAGYTIPSMILVPRDDHYIIYATSADTTYYKHGVNELEAVNLTITSVYVNETYSFLNMTYDDSTLHTTGGYINVTQQTGTPGSPAYTILAAWPVTGNSFSNSTGISHNLNHVGGFVNATITHSDFGTIHRTFPFKFNSVPVSFLGFGTNIQLLVALGMMMFTLMLAGATHGKQVVFIAAIEGWIFLEFGWFNALIARGVTEFAIVTVLGIMTVVAIFANMANRKKWL